jgi:DNA mismatch endonuclease (patch repair protein)
MQANKHADTKPEVALRSRLHRRGLRFRKDVLLRLDGGRVRPDIVFPGVRVAVFCDGCFWHRCPLHATDPKTNAAYWAPKLAANVRRDREGDEHLREAGWTVARIWEHEIESDVEAAADRIARLVAGSGSPNEPAVVADGTFVPSAPMGASREDRLDRDD